MDILKIRKLAKKNIRVEEAAPSAPAPAAPPGPTKKRKKAAPKVDEVDEVGQVEQVEQVQQVEAKPKASAPEPAAPARAPAAADAGDPLREFLARYDLEEALVYDGGGVLVHEYGRPRFLAFSLEGEEYAVSIMDVREILRVVSLTEVPRAPEQILGVLSKRGVVMPIVDLAAALGLRAPKAEMNARQRVLVVGDGSAVAGLRVDELHEVVELQAGDIEEVPASLGARSVHLLRGLGRSGNRMYILLDVEELLVALAQAGGAGEAQ